MERNYKIYKAPLHAYLAFGKSAADKNCCTFTYYPI